MPSSRPTHRRLLIAVLAAVTCAVPQVALAQEGTGTGGASPDDPQFKPPPKAHLRPDGTAVAPAGAPAEVQAVIAAANRIAFKPYRYGGGHTASFRDTAYDCSGSVSYALHGGGFLRSPLSSSDFYSWGQSGRGRWITVYTNPGHAFAVIDGLRFDTSMRTAISSRYRRSARGSTASSRWSRVMRSTRGYTARHPAGF